MPGSSLSGVDCNVNSWPLSNESKAYQQEVSMSIRYFSDQLYYTFISGCQFDLNFLENKSYRFKIPLGQNRLELYWKL